MSHARETTFFVMYLTTLMSEVYLLKNLSIMPLGIFLFMSCYELLNCFEK